MNLRKLMGLAVLIVVAVVVLILTMVDFDSLKRKVPERLAPLTLNLYYGGEKEGFLNNPEVLAILDEDYKIQLNGTRRGSIAMSTTDNTTDQHCIWPSNQVAVELARRSGKSVISDQVIFNSPIVFYTWAPVTAALTKAGIVEERENTHYIIKPQELIKLAAAKEKWESLGLDLYGSIKVFSSDPRKSNSGNMWAALLAGMLNNGEVIDETTVDNVLPQLVAYFRSMGFMEEGSGDIFENFLNQGMGARPMIVGYESQLPEFILKHPEYQTVIKEQINILYPEPTIFSSHPLIVLKPECERLTEAFRDPRIQAIAWSQHGFRSGFVGVESDPTVLTVTGIPASINKVMPMPSALVMERIIGSLSNL